MSVVEQSNDYRVPFQETKRIFVNTVGIQAGEATGRKWEVIDSPALHDEWGISYEDEFRGFGPNLISRALRKKRKQGIPTTFLDLAGGSGAAARELQQKRLISRGLTISLTDLRQQGQKDFDNENGLSYFSGNLLGRKVWNQIDSWVRDASPYGAFDVIVCRAIGGFPYSPELSAAAYNVLLNRVWQQLTPNNGLFLSEGPYLKQVDHVRAQEYLNNPANFPGAEVDTIFSQAQHRPLQLEKLRIRKTFASNFDLTL